MSQLKKLLQPLTAVFIGAFVISALVITYAINTQLTSQKLTTESQAAQSTKYGQCETFKCKETGLTKCNSDTYCKSSYEGISQTHKCIALTNYRLDSTDKSTAYFNCTNPPQPGQSACAGRPGSYEGCDKSSAECGRFYCTDGRALCGDKKTDTIAGLCDNAGKPPAGQPPAGGTSTCDASGKTCCESNDRGRYCTGAFSCDPATLQCKSTGTDSSCNTPGQTCCESGTKGTYCAGNNSCDPATLKCVAVPENEPSADTKPAIHTSDCDKNGGVCIAQCDFAGCMIGDTSCQNMPNATDKSRCYKADNPVCRDQQNSLNYCGCSNTTISLGQSGQASHALQHLLTNKSCYKGSRLGTYDQETADAVKKYLEKNKKTGVDGTTVTPDTWKLLCNQTSTDCDDQSSPPSQNTTGGSTTGNGTPGSGGTNGKPPGTSGGGTSSQPVGTAPKLVCNNSGFSCFAEKCSESDGWVLTDDSKARSCDGVPVEFKNPVCCSHISKSARLPSNFLNSFIAAIGSLFGK